MRTSLKRAATAVAAGALGLTGACKEATSVADLNNLPSSVIANGFTPTTFSLLASGAFNQDRANNGFAYIIYGETMGRDVYNIDPSENRYITELLGAPIDPSAFTGGGAYTGNFTTIRTANTVLDGIGTLSSAYSAPQLAAASGALRTLKALSYYRVIELRGTNGTPIAVDQPIGATPAPILCEPSALAAISALLDSADANLAAATAGSVTAFPFPLPTGFSSNGTFNTVAGFRSFERALKGKVEVYRGIKAQGGNPASAAGAANFTAAIAAFTQANSLNSAYVNPTGSLNVGPYYTYSTAAGDQTNPLAVATVFLNPTIKTNTLGGGYDTLKTGDARSSKIVVRSAAVTRFGVTTLYGQTVVSAALNTASLPILRNAETLLLRAQANIGLGNLAAAAADINAVRTTEGGLAPIATPATASAAVDAVLYDKRFSLLLQSPTRLQDLRSYGRLNATYYPQATTVDTYQTQLPTPFAEVTARQGNATCTN